MLRLAIAAIAAGISIALTLGVMLRSIYESGITPMSVVLGLFAVGILQMATIWFWNDTKRVFPPS